MPRGISSLSESEEEKINGRNGAYHEFGPEIWEGNMARRSVAILGLLGSITDAQAGYYAMPGSTFEGWCYLERLLEPLRRFVIDGDPPWTQPRTLSTEESYRLSRGVPTPEGDCAEDALPRELRNPYRAQEKTKFLDTGNGAES